MKLVSFFSLALLFPFMMSHAQESKPQVIILLGPPASGKGTQASKLAEELKLPHISTGDLFRENIGNKTPLGNKAKSYIDQGKLVPDELVLDMLFARVSQPDCEKGYVLDGFPRTIPQASALEERLAGKVNLKVINLKVSDETLIKRTSGRRSCPKCKEVYNIYFNPPEKEGFCKCGEPLVQRDDDKPEVVKERLKVYKAQTEPLIEFYEKRGEVKHIDGEMPPKEVFQAIVNYVQKT
ncbi:MAG: adenylate kinase [Chlamydiia bacterium]|nr:adenylate kinase [Chlamydiia bacterium]